MQAYGCNDDRFSYENFGNQPDWLIFQAVEFFSKLSQQADNRNAKIHAIGWSGLFNGLSGKNNQKIEAWQLLPFPHLEREQQQRVSPKTAQLLASLIQEQQLPRRVLAAAQQIQEVSEWMADDDDD